MDRLKKDDYFKFIELKVPLIEKALGTPVDVIKSYSAKDSFGDLDIVASKNSKSNEAIQAVFEALSATHISRNSDVISYRVPVEDNTKWFGSTSFFQVDLIFIDEEDLEFAKNYFAFNDLGNLIGRIAHAMGFKFGHEGLWYVVRKGTHVLENIKVSSNFGASLTFLGFDAERYLEGFETAEDIYRYVADSAFFNPDIFLLHNRNHAARTRDSKRKTYTGFLE